MKNRILEEQQKICKQYSAQFTSSDMESIIGISDNTNGINVLLNGLRHQPKDNNSGWYIWSGKELSQNEDFFKPLHVKHLVKKCPQVLKFLALPPGYRFLIDNEGYADVWYDPKLLKV